MGSYRAGLPRLPLLFPGGGGEDAKLAEGSIPIDPVITEASSESISPILFSATITSNSDGFVIIFIAALSASICISSTSG